jgi:aminopeptidase YwaD
MFCCLSITATASDLYKVFVRSQADAELLTSAGVEAVLRVEGGYLVLADDRAVKIIHSSKLESHLLASGIDKNQLAIDKSHDRTTMARYETIYEEDNLRLFRVESEIWPTFDAEDQLSPILIENLSITYQKKMVYNPRAMSGIVGLDSLIDLVSQDSIESYMYRLQAFNGRVAGTDSNHAATAWLASKLESFGYDSVVFDSFTFTAQGNLKQCRNVIATKVGNRLPQWQVIVGAHMDAVNGSPGADDNGTGTAGVLELARILANVETDLTFIFVPFDGEEWGLYGSWHYANRAAVRGDHIVYMLNMDMIAEITNSDRSNLYYGDETAFSELWADLADSLTGITATFRGSSGGSDHYPFAQNGFHATFVQEYYFSNVYHSPQDSTTYLNFEYMTRMVKASLATVYTVNLLPPPVIITSVIDGGDGQSLQVNWESMSPELIDHFWIYYWISSGSDVDSIQVPGTESSALLTGLLELRNYGIYVLPFNSEGQTSVEYDTAYARTYTIPQEVEGLAAAPVYHGIGLSWNRNLELDMSHYRIVRDYTLLPDNVTDTTFIDDDPALGKAIHSYMVFAVDTDGINSDTVNGERVTSKAAMMDQGRILAINRSHMSPNAYLVDETITGGFLRDALTGYDFDYMSDTAHAIEEKTSQLSLYDLIDYELVIVGGESARSDDFAASASMGGRLDTLAYYMSIGGKLIIFGRWGELDFEATLYYNPGSPEYSYNQVFNIAARNLTLTSSTSTELFSDLIGGHSQLSGYPDLMWDSTATVSHSSPYTDVSGIPCVTYPTFNSAGLEILYTYNSSDDGSVNEGQPMAWRDPGHYVFFEFPLSFMERDLAISTIDRAVSDFGFDMGTVAAYPDTVDIWADETEMIDIFIGNLTGGHSAGDIDVSSIIINSALAPISTEIVPSHPDFTGEALKATFGSAEFAATYGEIMGPGNSESFLISWNYLAETDTNVLNGDVVVHGYICGDPNTDGTVNIADAVYLINYTFKSGPAPFPHDAGDTNGDGGISTGDIVYIVSYVFKGGFAPVCTPWKK